MAPSRDPTKPAPRASVEGKRPVRNRPRHIRVTSTDAARPAIAQNCRGLREADHDALCLCGRSLQRLCQTLITEVGALVQDQESPGAISEIHESAGNRANRVPRSARLHSTPAQTTQDG